MLCLKLFTSSHFFENADPVKEAWLGVLERLVFGRSSDTAANDRVRGCTRRFAGSVLVECSVLPCSLTGFGFKYWKNPILSAYVSLRGVRDDGEADLVWPVSPPD